MTCPYETLLVHCAAEGPAMPVPNLFRMFLLNTLFVEDSSTFPRLQLLQFPRSPFFGNLKRIPVWLSSSNLFSSQMFLKISAETWHEISGSPAFSISNYISRLHQLLYTVFQGLDRSSNFFWCWSMGCTLRSISFNASGISAIVSGS